MKAALYTRPKEFAVVTKELRRLAPGEVLIKVESCGVCGTDLHIVDGTSRSAPPVVLGHEYAGTVAEVGPGVRTFRPGDRVAVDPNISCGTCSYCRIGAVHLCSNLRALGVDIDGGMAEYSIVPAGQLYPVPSSLSTQAAAFIEPVSCIVHGIDRARMKTGDTVVIVGGGAIGLLLLQLVRASGASRVFVVEPVPAKQEIAKTLGANAVLAPAEAPAALKDLAGIGADLVLECVGKPETMRQALSFARRGGTVEFFGVCPVGETIQIEPNDIYFRELTIVGSYVNPHTFSRAIDLLASGIVRIDALRVSSFPLDRAPEALAHLRTGKSVKCIIEPGA